MSDASEVKRWRQWKKFDDGSIEIYPWNSSTGPDVPCFITAEDHDRIVDELRAELNQLKRMYDGLMVSARITRESNAKTITRQARVIEKLKLAVTDIANKNTCWRLYEIDKYKSYEDGWEGVAEFAGKVLNELEDVEQGEGM